MRQFRRTFRGVRWHTIPQVGGRINDRPEYWRLLRERGTFHVNDETLDDSRFRATFDIPRVHFNIALEELKQWYKNGGKDEDELQQRKKIKEFIDAREQQDLRANARGVLDEFIKLRDNVKTGPKPSEIGPADTNETDSGARIRWVYDELQSDPENENGILSYIWEAQDGGQTHRLTFRQVRSSDEGPVTYLSVTYLSIDEVSVRLFWDLIRERADDDDRIWTDLNKVIPGGNPPSPVAWKWDNESSPTGIVLTREWMKDAPTKAKRDLADYYEKDVRIDPPADGHPIQQITPAAAIYVARLINCRLPTVEEWSQAASPVAHIFDGSLPDKNNWNSAVEFSALDEELPNLRDETWRTQHEYILGTREKLKDKALARDAHQYLDERIFIPVDADIPKGDDAFPGVDWDDETLWFRATSQNVTSQDGGRFRNIIGNVAEFVFRDDSSILFNGEYRSLDEIHRSLGDQRTDLPVRVIGGSALSDCANVPVMEAQQIQRWKRGYSDVGFRLAFTARPLKKSWEARLAELMDPTPPFVLAADTADPPQGSSDGS